jgi:thiamine-phosphate pyrophosphorylase
MASSPRERLRGLYAITPENADTEALVASVALCLEGGAGIVQYRAKSAVPTLALAQSRRLAALCQSFGALFIVNDSIELASASGADGVHLGRDDTDLAQARRALPQSIIGVSCYSDPALARTAARDGADYVAIGSVFASATKPGATRAALSAIGEARRLSGLPVAAIGGITLDNAHEALEAGAEMLAVINALFTAQDIRAAARGFSNCFDELPGDERGTAKQRAL